MNNKRIRQIALLAGLTVVLILQACSPTQDQPRLPVPSLTVTPPASTQEPLTINRLMQSCPTQEEIAFIDSQTEIIFRDDPTGPNLVCRAADGSKDLTLLKKNVYNTLRVMRLLSFDLPLPWTDLDLFDWFAQAVNGIVFDPNAKFSRCCDDEQRIVIQTQFLLAAQTDLWLDSYHGGAGVNSLLPMLVHEARHAEGYPHLCGTILGNDINLQEMGAWAVEYYLDLWITDHTHAAFFTTYHKEIAHANAQLILDTRFCWEAPFP